MYLLYHIHTAAKYAIIEPRRGQNLQVVKAISRQWWWEHRVLKIVVTEFSCMHRDWIHVLIANLGIHLAWLGDALSVIISLPVRWCYHHAISSTTVVLTIIIMSPELKQPSRGIVELGFTFGNHQRLSGSCVEQHLSIIWIGGRFH